MDPHDVLHSSPAAGRSTKERGIATGPCGPTNTPTATARAINNPSENMICNRKNMEKTLSESIHRWCSHHHQTGDFSWCFWGDQWSVPWFPFFFRILRGQRSAGCSQVAVVWLPILAVLESWQELLPDPDGASFCTRETAGKTWKNVVLSCPSSVAHISCIFLGAAQKHHMNDMQSIAQRFVIDGPQTSKLCRSIPVITNFRMHPNDTYWLQPCRKIGSNLEIRQASAWVRAKADSKPGGIALVLEESAVDCQPEFRLGGWLLPDESLLALSLTMGKNPRRYPALGWSCKTTFFGA